MHHTTPFIYLSTSFSVLICCWRYMYVCVCVDMMTVCVCVCRYVHINFMEQSNSSFNHVLITTPFTVLITPPKYIFTPFTCTVKRNFSLDAIPFTVI